ncbi:MAG: hypothetical protein EXR70_24660 [Deltaproteobacteria bacterium]|nr:hypothetical protein [Deltaproteobacteria bacterium]
MAIQELIQPANTKAAGALSDAKLFAVNVNVVRRCSIAVDLASDEKLAQGENRRSVSAKLDRAVTIACSPGANQNVRIGDGSSAPAPTIPLGDPVQQKLRIEGTHVITVDF